MTFYLLALLTLSTVLLPQYYRQSLAKATDDEGYDEQKSAINPDRRPNPRAFIKGDLDISNNTTASVTVDSKQSSTTLPTTQDALPRAFYAIIIIIGIIIESIVIAEVVERLYEKYLQRIADRHRAEKVIQLLKDHQASDLNRQPSDTVRDFATRFRKNALTRRLTRSVLEQVPSVDVATYNNYNNGNNDNSNAISRNETAMKLQMPTNQTATRNDEPWTTSFSNSAPFVANSNKGDIPIENHTLDGKKSSAVNAIANDHKDESHTLYAKKQFQKIVPMQDIDALQIHEPSNNE